MSNTLFKTSQKMGIIISPLMTETNEIQVNNLAQDHIFINWQGCNSSQTVSLKDTHPFIIICCLPVSNGTHSSLVQQIEIKIEQSYSFPYHQRIICQPLITSLKVSQFPCFVCQLYQKASAVYKQTKRLGAKAREMTSAFALTDQFQSFLHIPLPK